MKKTNHIEKIFQMLHNNSRGSIKCRMGGITYEQSISNGTNICRDSS